MAQAAHKQRAKNLSERTGMKHVDALATVDLAHNPPQPPHRWVLSDDIRAFAAGEGWHGIYFEPFYDVLNRLKVRFECDWCAEDADARTEDCTIQIVVGKYDPDLSPVTPWLSTKKFHARCQPSKVAWAVRVPERGGSYDIALHATAKPDMHGEFALTARPMQSELDREVPPILFITAKVTEDHGQGAAPWINELEFFLRAHGFTHPDGFGWTEEDEPDEWSLRIVTDFDNNPTWIALRMTPPTLAEAPDHLFLGQLRDSITYTNLPSTSPPFDEDWTCAAHAAGKVLVVFGPLTVKGQLPDVDMDKLTTEQLDDLLHEKRNEELDDLLDGVKFSFIVREVRLDSVEPEPAGPAEPDDAGAEVTA